MARRKFTKAEMALLRKNPNVKDTTETRITYSLNFKIHFMEQYNAGVRPTAIFRESGFDTDLIGYKRIERATQRWKRSYAAGKLGGEAAKSKASALDSKKTTASKKK